MLASGQVNNTALHIPEEMLVSSLPWQDESYIGVAAFFVDISTWHDPSEYVLLTVGRAQSNGIDTCATTYNTTTCKVLPAIAEYDVDIDGEHISFATPAKQARITARANNTHETLDSSGTIVPSTLTGIAQWLALQYASTVYRVGDFSESLNCGVFENVFSFELQSGNGSCANYSDPFETIMKGANELMFQTGIWAAQALNASQLHEQLDDGLTVNQTFQGHVQGSHVVFETNFWYFIAAALLELTCIALTLSNYWGYWRFGRPTSFSPLEIAKVSSLR